MCPNSMLTIFRDVVITAFCLAGLVVLVMNAASWTDEDDDFDDFGGYP